MKSFYVCLLAKQKPLMHESFVSLKGFNSLFDIFVGFNMFKYLSIESVGEVMHTNCGFERVDY